MVVDELVDKEALDAIPVNAHASMSKKSTSVDNICAKKKRSTITKFKKIYVDLKVVCGMAKKNKKFDLVLQPTKQNFITTIDKFFFLTELHRQEIKVYVE